MTVKDVAREAGVSPATVSRVLNGSARVSPDKVERVREVIERLGYKANPFSKSLLTEDLKTVGVLVPNLRDDFYGVIVNAIERRLLEHGVHMMCSLGHEDALVEEDAVQTFRSRSLNAYILLADLISDEAILELVKDNIPVVLIHRYLPELQHMCVNISNEHGGFIATQHLIELGHTRIAHITGPLNRHHTLGRYTGYMKALQQAGLPVDPALVQSVPGPQWEILQGERMTQRLLSRTRFTALFAYNDWLAIGAMRAVRAAGLRIPEDISIVSFDNRFFTEVTDPPLTGVDFPRETLGVLAADRVIALMNGQDVQMLPDLKPELVVRGSTAAVKKG
ncbi:LacI family DNA-binding transcriptional regulator [Deinococcus roseus]|uniref:LacI family DNA-binding transcriptional regulator n=1 Tax=Deinococcus roseus TaxID=392414 RepID=UPI00166A5CE3|nr:LacI family DNA-binding transcriptional regulator [Deinococcus roseus]